MTLLTDPADLPEDLRSRIAERHPVEPLHQMLDEDGHFGRGPAETAARAFASTVSWAETHDRGGRILPVLNAAHTALFATEVPDTVALGLLRIQAATAGLPPDHAWGLTTAAAVAGERRAIQDVASAWAAVACRLADTLFHLGLQSLEGMARAERDRIEMRMERANVFALAWAAQADKPVTQPFRGRELPAAVAGAHMLLPTLFVTVALRQRDEGYADGVAALAAQRARDGSNASPKPGLDSLEDVLADKPTTVADTLRERGVKRGGVVVVPEISTTVKKDVEIGIKNIEGRALQVLKAKDLAGVRGSLIAEFPHAAVAVDSLLDGLSDGAPLRLRPAVLVGDPGGGKSRLARRLLEELALPFATLDAGTTADHGLTGSPRRWTNSYPSLPLSTVARHRVANPALLIDELEKAGRSSAGSMHEALLSLLEPLTAKAWRDHHLDVEIDVSRVNWLFTANALAGIPDPLRNRLRVITVPRPGAEHLPALAASILRDAAGERGEDPRMTPALDGEELAALAEAWGDGGSLRTLRRYVDGLLAARRFTVTPN